MAVKRKEKPEAPKKAAKNRQKEIKRNSENKE